MAPKVYNWKDPQRPANGVYIGRGSPWGNPFRIGIDGSRNRVCDRFKKEILPHLDLRALIGKDLICYCKPLRCHGDDILEAIKERHNAGEE